MRTQKRKKRREKKKKKKKKKKSISAQLGILALVLPQTGFKIARRSP